MSDRLALPSETPESSFSLSHRMSAVLVALVSSLAVVVAYCLPGVGIANAGTNDVSCRSGGAVVIVGGTNDPEGKAMIGVEQRYKGTGPASNNSNAGKYDVVYVDYPTTLWPLGAAGYDDSVAQGETATKSAIASYQASCPGKPVVVAGYSQGARVAGDVLSEIGQAGAKGEKIKVVLVDKDGNYIDKDGNRVTDPVTVEIDPSQISGELYSDPRQAGNKHGRGIELSLFGIIPGLTMTGSRGADDEDSGFGSLEGRVTSVCVDGDPICDLPDPLYDPIGAIDGLLGYFTKHGLYPYQMYRDPKTGEWTTDRTVSCDERNVCMVSADSAFAELFQGWAKDLGLTGITIPDFLANRPTIDVPFGFELAHLQKPIRLIEGLLPPLPKLGYGAYLPDMFVFQNILEGIVTLAPAKFEEGVTDLAASVRSIVLLPVNFVKYWAGQIVTAGPTITSGVTPLSATEVAGDDPDPAEKASLRKAFAILATDQESTNEQASSKNDTVEASNTVDNVAGNDEGNNGQGGTGEKDDGQKDDGQDSTTQDVPTTTQPEKHVVTPTPGNDESGDGNGGDGDGQQDQNHNNSTENTEKSTTTTDNKADDSTSNSDTSKSDTSKSDTSKSDTSKSNTSKSDSDGSISSNGDSDSGSNDSGNSGSGNNDSTN